MKSQNVWALTGIGAAVLVAGWILTAAEGHSPALRSAHSEPAPFTPTMMIAVTEEGKLYHRPDCTFIHGPAMLEQAGQAIADGYTPCTRCMKQR